MDYPLWRYMMTEHRDKFNHIYIIFHKQGIPDMRKFVRKAFPKACYIDMPDPGSFWRQNSLNLGLYCSKNEWVWLTEMDFFAKEDYFFVQMFKQAEKADGVVFDVGERFHPACMLLRRSTLDKTDCFIDPAYHFAKAGKVLIEALLDHGAVMKWQLQEVGKFKTLKEIGLKNGEDFYHLEDLTHNYDRVKVGNVDEQHQVKDFLIYNAISRHAPGSSK